MYIKIALPTNSSVHGGIVKDGWMPDESKFVQTVILFTFAKIFSKKKFFSGVGKSFWFGAQLYFTMNYRPKFALFAFQCLSNKKSSRILVNAAFYLLNWPLVKNPTLCSMWFSSLKMISGSLQRPRQPSSSLQPAWRRAAWPQQHGHGLQL